MSATPSDVSTIVAAHATKGIADAATNGFNSAVRSMNRAKLSQLSLVLPTDLVERTAAMKSVANRFAPVLDQAVLCDFMTEGHFGRHVRRMRQAYAERLAVLLESARQSLAGLLEISELEAGLQTTGWLCGKVGGAAAAAAAARRRVEVTPLSRYSRSPLAREGVVLGFAAVDVREIRRGVRELAIALEQCRRAP